MAVIILAAAVRIAEHRRFDRACVQLVQIIDPATWRVARVDDPQDPFTVRLLGVRASEPTDEAHIDRLRECIADRPLLITTGGEVAGEGSACWAWVYDPDGMLLNEWVVLEGLGRAGDDPTHDLQWWMKRLERRARREGRGMWRAAAGE